MPADGISRPSFTPATATSPSPQAAKPAPSSPSTQASPSAPQSSSASSGYQGSGYQPSSSYSPPNYSRSAWSSTPDTPTATVTADSAGFASPAGTNGTRSEPSSAGSFSSTAAGAAAGLGGAAAGLGGAAAGLASSVTAALRGGSGPRDKSAPKIKVRRSSKRQAMLTLSRLEPWSVMKFSFVASVVAFIILFVAVAVLYMVLSALGVFTSLENQVASITSAKNTAGTNISHWFSASLILGWTAMLGALNIVLITALSTIGSVIYNLIAKTVGGVEVTLRETD
jgi:hypothetical protein